MLGQRAYLMKALSKACNAAFELRGHAGLGIGGGSSGT